MNKEMKNKWIAALRSGNYKQGKMHLYNRHDNTYCCLGVLCAINNIEIPTEDFNEEAGYKFIMQHIRVTTQTILWNLNDIHGKSFEEIADYIEENL